MKSSYNSEIVRRTSTVVRQDSTSAFIAVEVKVLRPSGERRRWSKVQRKVLIGSSVHQALEGKEGRYYDFLRDMYRLPVESVK